MLTSPDHLSPLSRRSFMLLGLTGALTALGCSSDDDEPLEEPTGTITAVNLTGIALKSIKLTGPFGTVTENDVAIGESATFIEVWPGGVTVTAYNAQDQVVATKTGVCLENETVTLELRIAV